MKKSRISGIYVQLEGAETLREKFRALPMELKTQIAGEVEKGLKAMLNEARRNQKSQFSQRSKTLWKNTLYILDRDGMGGSVGAFNEAFYGHFLEFGRRKDKMKARPWLYPAFKAHKPKFINRVKRIVRRLRLSGVSI